MESISLLWPGEKGVGAVDFSTCREDLQLTELASLLLAGLSGQQACGRTMELLTSDPATIAWRQDIISDLMEEPALVAAFSQAETLIARMQHAVEGIRENAEGFTSGGVMNGFRETLDKLERLFGTKSNMIEESDLDNYYGQLFRATIFSYRLSRDYVELLCLLQENLREECCRSAGLKALRTWVAELYASDQVGESKKIIEEISRTWNGVGGFSVDILVDRGFHVMGMELSHVQSEPYVRPGVVTGRTGEKTDGIGGLSEFPAGGATARFQECMITALGAALKGDLTKLRNLVSRIPVTGVKGLLDLGEELPFYTGVCHFLTELKARGADVACPTTGDGCYMEVEGAYPVALVLLHEKTPAANDVYLPAGGTVNFITGANSSGKTTWLITAGQLQWLYQLGCHLPCKTAKMTPVDGLYTLFASGESLSGEDSRMGMEAIKLSSFRDKLTEKSLVLLNEPMTSTNAQEGVEICMDLLYELIERKVSAMMVTHYNEIYNILHTRLVRKHWESRLESYVMEIDRENGVTSYPFRLRKRLPDRSSHAEDIVRKVGVTLEDMLHSFQQAGLPVNPDAPAWKYLHCEEEGN